MELPTYYAILPAEVRYDDSLTLLQKMLYAEITALTEASGKCWASNEYFAKLYKKDKLTISRQISALKEKGYIDVKVVYKDESKEIEKRYISLLTKKSIGIDKNINRVLTKKSIGIDKNIKDNNTSINNTRKNNKENILKEMTDDELLDWLCSDETEPPKKEDKFEEFWKEYPKKVGKGVAKQSFKKALSKESFDVIIDAVKKQKVSAQWSKDGGQFIPNPSTWLNQERWEDELEVSEEEKERLKREELRKIAGGLYL